MAVARGSAELADSGTTRETTSEPRRTRHPVWATSLWSDRVRTRAAAGSTAVRPKARGDPCADERSGWLAPPGCACASGTRASSPDGDCWAGTCACSRSTPEMDLHWYSVARRPDITTESRRQPRYGRPSTVRGGAYLVKRRRLAKSARDTGSVRVENYAL
jgi:hypothetical protein